MKLKYKIISVLTAILLTISLASVSVLAITEDEVESKVEELGSDAVTGNIFVWFLCAIAFLKVSQKIDSFMSSLGINVGHTGGSMLSEAIIAARGLGAVKNAIGGGYGKSAASSEGGGNTFMKGGLSGIVSRKITNSAVNNANGTKSGGLGGAVFNSSLSKGGSFANSVIGNIAAGDASMGTITGEKAAEALKSYMGYGGLEDDAENVPSFSEVEIGGGHIFATETDEEHPGGIRTGMYNTDRYMPPEGDYTTVTAADGTTWYKQYASDTVERTPYTADDGSIGYNKSIVKKLPRSPRRKDSV